MAISYPLSTPDNPKPSSVRWIEVNVCGVQTNPYTLQSQSYQYSGMGWGIEVSFDPISREEAQPWIAFLSALKGKSGTFMFGDTLCAVPLGSGSGNPKVEGGGQLGGTLVTSGWAPNQLVLKAADKLQIGNSLYRNLLDVTSDSSGNATLEVWPNLRQHVDQEAIEVNSPKGRFRLTENIQATQFAAQQQLYIISFRAEEAL